MQHKKQASEKHSILTLCSSLPKSINRIKVSLCKTRPAQTTQTNQLLHNMKLLFALAISALAVAIPAPSLEGGAANLLHQVASSDPLLARTALIASSPNLINQVTTQTVKATRFMATMEQVRSLISVVSSVVQRFRAPQAQAALAKDLHNPAVAQELEGLQAKAAQLTAQIHAHLDPMMEAASSAAVKSPKAAELASSMAGKIRFRSISPSVAAEASEGRSRSQKS